jgi:hypothetical protein
MQREMSVEADNTHVIIHAFVNGRFVIEAALNGFH